MKFEHYLYVRETQDLTQAINSLPINKSLLFECLKKYLKENNGDSSEEVISELLGNMWRTARDIGAGVIGAGKQAFSSVKQGYGQGVQQKQAGVIGAGKQAFSSVKQGYGQGVQQKQIDSAVASADSLRSELLRLGIDQQKVDHALRNLKGSIKKFIDKNVNQQNQTQAPQQQSRSTPPPLPQQQRQQQVPPPPKPLPNQVNNNAPPMSAA